MSVVKLRITTLRKEIILMKKVKADLNNEGRDNVFLDVDRMINEGLSGGSVHMREDSTNIEEARNLALETPPNK
jgi:hypothetical protein